MPSTLVSIVVPTYNSENYVRDQINCLKNQTHENWEVFYVDDHSADNTVAILNEYAATDGRIKIIVKDIRGGNPALSRVVGANLSQGKFLCFLDHDDLWTQDKLQCQLKAFEVYPSASIIYTAREIFGNEVPQAINEKFAVTTGVMQKQDPDLIFRKNFITWSSGMVPRKLYEDVGGLPTGSEFLAVDDYYLWIRLAEKGELVYIDLPLSYWRQHDRNLGNNQEIFIPGIRAIAKDMETRGVAPYKVGLMSGQAIKSEGVMNLVDHPVKGIRLLARSLRFNFQFKTLVIICFGILNVLLPSSYRAALFARLHSR